MGCEREALATTFRPGTKPSLFKYTAYDGLTGLREISSKHLFICLQNCKKGWNVGGGSMSLVTHKGVAVKGVGLF